MVENLLGRVRCHDEVYRANDDGRVGEVDCQDRSTAQVVPALGERRFAPVELYRASISLFISISVHGL